MSRQLPKQLLPLFEELLLNDQRAAAMEKVIEERVHGRGHNVREYRSFGKGYTLAEKYNLTQLLSAAEPEQGKRQ